MKRVALAFLAFALLSGCGGKGGSSIVNALSGGPVTTPASGNRPIGLTLTIPSSGSASASSTRRAQTVSSSTQSATVAVNGGTPQVFNVSGSSCSNNNGALTCTFSVGAPYGLDTFLVLTYSSSGGSGSVLNAAAATLNVTPGGPNTLSATAGNVVYVTTNSDTGTGSLRAAVTGAASGVTTAVLFQGVTGTIALASPITVAQNVAIIGPGASSLAISGGGATSLFAVNSGVNAVIFGLTLTQGSSANPGGAIASQGNLAIFSSTFSSNASTSAGGAISAQAGSLVVTGATFSSNSVTSSASYPQGGAIQSFVPATIDSSVFQGNSITASSSTLAFGGAISEDREPATGLTVTNSQFYSNSVSAPLGSAYAGAIEDNSSAPTLTLENDTFGKSGGGNSVSGSYDAGGGAIEYFNEAAGTISDGGIGGNSFVANTATTGTGGSAEGGALYVDDAGDVVAFTGSNTFTGNSATAGAEANGGAIADFYTGGSMATGSGTTFSANVVKTTDSTDYGAFGGAISYYYFPCYDDQGSIARRPGASPTRAAGSLPLAMRPSAKAASTRRKSAATRHAMSASMSAIGGTFTSNTAGPSASYGAGGGAFSISYQTGAAPPFAISNATITSNVATGVTYGEGGGVAIYSGIVTISGSTIGSQGQGNSGTTQGGGILVSYNGGAYNTCETEYAGSLTLVNSAVEGNSVTAANQTYFGGGGIANYSSTVAINASTVAYNSVTSSNSGGGGLLAQGGTFSATTSILNSTFFANTSSDLGGGLLNAYAGSPSTIAITNSTAYENTATSYGGNIYNANGDGSNVVSAQNSLAAGGSAATGADIWNADTFTSLGYNLIQQSSNYGSGSSNAPQTGDIVGQSPLLASLANNGGPTQTLADSASSPGKGHIPFSGGLCNGAAGTGVDQRGYTRGAGGVCDIGAYEFSGVAP